MNTPKRTTSGIMAAIAAIGMLCFAARATEAPPPEQIVTTNAIGIAQPADITLDVAQPKPIDIAVVNVTPSQDIDTTAVALSAPPATPTPPLAPKPSENTSVTSEQAIAGTIQKIVVDSPAANLSEVAGMVLGHDVVGSVTSLDCATTTSAPPNTEGGLCYGTTLATTLAAPQQLA